MTDLVLLKVAKPKRWAVAKPTRKFYRHRKTACRSKGPVPGRGSQDRRSVGLIAVAHEREASQRWDTQLGQGDPLNQVSVHVPAGRGPFRSGEDGALDALVNCAPFAARNKDWLVRGMLTILGLVLIAVPVRAHDHNQPGLKPWFYVGLQRRTVRKRAVGRR